jgi:ABC-2 type transport system ATP-binding protein
MGRDARLLAGRGTLVRAADGPALYGALRTAHLIVHPSDDGALYVDAEPVEVGRAALDGGVALTQLGPSDGCGLEQLFFELTAKEAA